MVINPVLGGYMPIIRIPMDSLLNYLDPRGSLGTYSSYLMHILWCHLQVCNLWLFGPSPLFWRIAPLKNGGLTKNQWNPIPNWLFFFGCWTMKILKLEFAQKWMLGLTTSPKSDGFFHQIILVMFIPWKVANYPQSHPSLTNLSIAAAPSRAKASHMPTLARLSEVARTTASSCMCCEASFTVERGGTPACPNSTGRVQSGALQSKWSNPATPQLNAAKVKNGWSPSKQRSMTASAGAPSSCLWFQNQALYELDFCGWFCHLVMFLNIVHSSR